MKIIDGKKIADSVNNETKNIINTNKLKPGLAILLIGNNEASEIYVRNKIKKCEELGINAHLYRLKSGIEEEKIVNLIKDLNEDNNIHGIIIQSPVKGYNEEYLNSFIAPCKDVDGFGIYNMGCLASNKENILPATPMGIIKLLEHENIEVKHKNVVVVGRSKIVGRPMALLLLNRDATVCITHSKTCNLKEITSQADILIVAIGVPNFITEKYVKKDAVVIDVGINRVDDKIFGDVDFNSVKDKVSAITPVPGGVGPMTIASLLRNVVISAKNYKK